MNCAWNEQVFSPLRVKVCRVLALFLMVLVVSVFHSVSVVAAESGSGTEAVKKTLDQVLAILADEQFKQPDRSKDRIAALEKIIGERFDYGEMGKRVLGREWKKLDGVQQKEFVGLFRKFLLSIYTGNVSSYSGEQVLSLIHI